jgi:multidrug resistance efflux pump
MLWLGGVFRSGEVSPGHRARDPGAGLLPVATVDVHRRAFTESFEGAVRSARTTYYSARVSAPIRTLEPGVGDLVEPGKAFGSLDPSRLEGALAVAEAGKAAAERSLEASRVQLDLSRQRRTAAQAELELARAEHGRIVALVERGSATPSERDVAVARLRTAESLDSTAFTGIELSERHVTESAAQVVLREKLAAVARTELGYAVLSSPVGGRVVRRLLEPGSEAQPGAPILEFHDPADLQLEVPVRESLVPGLDRAVVHRVHLPALGRDVDATIVEVVPAAEAGSRTVRVRLRLPALPGLLPGMSGRVTFPSGTREVRSIPEKAVARTGQMTFVRVRDGGIDTPRFVRLGARVGEDRVEVIDGLEQGEQVVLGRGSDGR